MSVIKNIFARLEDRAFRPIDIASLVFFRIAFGSLMLWLAYYHFSGNNIARFWLQPRLAFKYYGFSWVQPLPGNGLYLLWIMLAVLALFITVGFLYRISAAFFCLGYTYTFLLDEGLWVNHRYLICLFSFLLVFVPAHRAFSIDARLDPKLRSPTAPAWTLWLLRAQIGVVYFYAGLVKLLPDWRHGEPMRVWLAHKTDFPLIGRFFREEWAVYAFSYTALLFDLLIVPFLLWRRTRVAAFFVALIFHFLNFRLFHLGVFPWLAIAATTLFLPPDWPRRVLRFFSRTKIAPAGARPTSLASHRRRVLLALVLAYIAIQILVPLRPFLYRGGIEWMQAEHRFSWRMMLVGKWERAYFYVTDPNTGRTYQVMPNDYLTTWQVDRMQWNPDMVLQYAQFLATVMPREGLKPLVVEARVLVALNGRKPQLFIDPNVNLAAEKRTWGRPRWLREVHEPLPNPPADPLHSPFEPRINDLD
jgi:vitamin K-dependent gamma-carboxylase